ncbi:MAG: alpha/beta hydrolase [Clostridiales bacterium]|jgi:acetyl esterase/lipase|nr:alpha/beta hydrolase [Clostridiales bacterium]
MKARTIFKIIDVSFDPVQNNGYGAFIKKNGISVTKDIVYDKNIPDIRVGDLYVKDALLTEPDAKLPVFINIHGGGFVAGDKIHRRYFSAYVADIGYAVFNINYGLSPEYKFPFCLLSIIKALDWVADNAEKYGFDTSKIVMSGDSAGANLAALGGIVASNPKFVEALDAQMPAAKPTALLLCCGPYDITTALQSNIPFDLLNKIITEATGYDKDHVNEFKYLNEFSPIEYINESYPKTFLIYSAKDIFCRQQGEVFEKLLKEKNISVSSFHSTSLLDNHCFHLNHNFKVAKAALDRSKEFLLSILNDGKTTEETPTEDITVSV